jgi:hypothetical protein
MAYVAYVTALKNVRKHPNADRLQLGDCFGNTVCVSMEYSEGQVGVYFPTDGQLSVEFAEQNNLLRKKDENGNNVGGYMDPNKRNVCAIRLRGEKSDGLFMPLSCLDYCYPHIKGGAAAMLNIGDTIDVVEGHEICQKYIPVKKNKVHNGGEGNRTRKKKVPVAPLFAEHADTEQLAYNIGAFRPGDLVDITLKMHGTSQRTGMVPVLTGFKRSLWDKLFRRDGVPQYSWGEVSGTRRTVLEDYAGGFYGSNEFRERHSKMFEGKLHKGETVYYEVVGFTDNGTPIMADCSNKKLNDKEFLKKYGETTVFSYGCAPDGYSVDAYWDDEETEPAVLSKVPQSDLYVYRMTFTNEDGDVVEYSPFFMRYRCEQMGVKYVPVLWQGFIPTEEELGDMTAGEWILAKAEEFYDGPDPIGKTHVREGVVVRLIDRPKFAAYKHKNFSFKVLEGIIKDTADAPDMEEAQEVQDGE